MGSFRFHGSRGYVSDPLTAENIYEEWCLHEVALKWFHGPLFGFDNPNQSANWETDQPLGLKVRGSRKSLIWCYADEPATHIIVATAPDLELVETDPRFMRWEDRNDALWSLCEGFLISRASLATSRGRKCSATI